MKVLENIYFYIDDQSPTPTRKALYRLRGIKIQNGNRIEFFHRYFKTRTEAEKVKKYLRDLITKLKHFDIMPGANNEAA